MNARAETLLFSITALLFAGIMLSGLADLTYSAAHPAAARQAVQAWRGAARAPTPDVWVRRDGSDRRG